MKEIKILAVLVIIVGVLYWGVEPLAHATFHPEVAKADFEFKDLSDIDLSKGNPQNGKTLVEQNCIACHALKDVGMEGGEMAMFSRDGKDATIHTPDLSTAGAIYSEKFLAHLILDPVNTLHLAHKFPDGDFPMIAYAGMGGDINQEVADMVAYLKSIGSVALKKQVLESEEFATKKEAIEKSKFSEGQKQSEIAKLEDSLTNKAVFLNACSRCHTMKYDKVVSKTTATDLRVYLGSAAPDLSTMIRSRGVHYLEHFINDPQRVPFQTIQEAVIKKEGTLPPNDKKSEWQDPRDYSNLAKELGVMPVGHSMPRVGLTEEAQDRVIAYMESIGDSKKAERENIGVYLMAFFAIMSVLAYLWKKRIWSEVH